MAEQKSSITKSVSKYKLVFVGDQSVGKTSIIHRFIYDNFTGVQQPTVGIDFVSKTLHLDNKTIRLQLWDTAGQERFRSLIPSYIRDSNTAIIVYDTTNQTSFLSVSKWIEYVREERGNDAIIVLVGNKIDIAEKRQVSKEEGENLSKQNQILFFEASAKTGVNIVNIFKTIAIQLQSQESKDPTEIAVPAEPTETPNKQNNNNNNNIQLQKPNSSDGQIINRKADNKQCQC